MQTRIGFIGAGLMGHGAVKHLLLNGYAVQLLAHRSRELIKDLIERGATETSSAAELAQNSDVLFLCLPNAAVVEQVATADGGLLEGAHPGLLVVDMTTSLPALTRRLADAFARYGAEFIDAPLARTPKEADLGKLNMMVGGSPQQYQRAQSLAQHFCENIWHIGAIGSAHTFKLLNNSIVAANIATVLEAAVAAERLGVDHELLVEICSQGGANSAALNMIMPYIVSQDSSTFQAHTATLLKDLRYYVQLTEEAGLGATMAQASKQLFQLTAAMGEAQTMVPKLYDTLRKLDDRR